MSDPHRDLTREIEALIAASSLGSAQARAMIEATPPEVARAILDRADELAAHQASCPVLPQCPDPAAHLRGLGLLD